MLEGFKNIKKINNHMQMKKFISPRVTDRSSNDSSKSNIDVKNTPRKVKQMNHHAKSQPFQKYHKATNKSHDYDYNMIKNTKNKNIFNNIFNIKELDLEQKESKALIPLCINKGDVEKFNVFSHNIIKRDLCSKVQQLNFDDEITKKEKISHYLNTGSNNDHNEEELKPACDDNDKDELNDDEEIEIIFNNLSNDDHDDHDEHVEITSKERYANDISDEDCETIIIKSNHNNNHNNNCNKEVVSKSL